MPKLPGDDPDVHALGPELPGVGVAEAVRERAIGDAARLPKTGVTPPDNPDQRFAEVCEKGR